MYRFICLIVSILSMHLNFINGTEQSIKEGAFSIYNQGFCLFQYALGEWKISHHFAEDISYIDHFPFDAYQVYRTDRNDQFFIDQNDYIKDSIRFNKGWEKGHGQLMQLLIKPGSTVIDMGAHIGTHAVTMSNCVGPNGYVVAFEPHKKIYRELCMNLSLNECFNVYPVRCAIGKERGFANLIHADLYNEGAAFIVPDEQGDTAVLKLDDFDLINVSFIKIDVENMELDVLEGAIETIKNNRPLILIEIQRNSIRANWLNEDTEKQKQAVLDKIAELGYELRYLNDPEAPADYLAIPKS